MLVSLKLRFDAVEVDVDIERMLMLSLKLVLNSMLMFNLKLVLNRMLMLSLKLMTFAVIIHHGNPVTNLIDPWSSGKSHDRSSDSAATESDANRF